MSRIGSVIGRAFLAIATVFFILSSATSVPAQATTHTIKMGSDSYRLVYVPENLTIQPGDTIKWVNNSVPPHNAIFEADRMPIQDEELADQLTKSQYLYKIGDSYETHFPDDAPAGEYHYYCVPHLAAGMRGVISVAEPDT